MFDVDPSAKIIRGVCLDPPASMPIYRSPIKSTVYCFASVEPPRGQNKPSEALTKNPTIGIFSTKSAAKKLMFPLRAHSKTGTSVNPI